MALTIDNINAGIAAGTINETVLSSTLEKLRNYAYSYLYNIQKDMVNICKTRTYYRHFTDVVDDIFTNNDFKYYKAFNISKPFIHPNMRLKFRRSKYYDTPLTNAVIAANREDLFIYNYLVFVNGYLDTSAVIKCKEELTTVCMSASAMGDLATQFVSGATVDILFLQDSYFIDTTLLKSALAAGNYSFTLNGKTIDSTSKVFAFISKGDTGLKRCYDVTMTNGVLTVPALSGQYFNDTETMNIKLLVVPNYSETFECDMNTAYMKHAEHNMPLPMNNTLVFSKGTDGSLSIDNSDILTEKYPSVFKLADNRTVTNEIYTFYWDSNTNSDLVFDTDMTYYIKLMKVLNKYLDGTIPTAISGFSPFMYEYDLTEYTKSEYAVQDYGPLLYKANKLSTMFTSWGFALQMYYELLRADTNGYIMSLAGRDLASKLRKNNSAEITAADSQKTFTEDRYVFIFKNSDADNALPYKFWIDGTRYIPDELYLDGTYEYVYIPTADITQTSTIEIERSADNVFSTTVSVGTGPTDLKFASDSTSCPFASLFLVDTDGNYVTAGKYQITAVVNGTTVNMDSSSTMVVSNASNMKISPATDDAANKTIIAVCNDTPMEFTKAVTLSNCLQRNLNDSSYIARIKADPSRIRIFKHGLLIPSEKYNITFPTNYKDNIVIDLNFDRYINQFEVDYLPEAYNVVYSADTIDANGIINLEGIINKPFSTKYYDVYVNGLRILPAQITKLSNFTISLSNLKTLRNLYIYEKQTGTEAIKFTDATSPLLSDVLLRTDADYKKAIMDFIVDMVDDTSIADVDTMFDVVENSLLGLIEDYLESNFISANETVPDTIVTKYKAFFKSNIFFIDAGIKYSSLDDDGTVYFLSPRLKPEMPNINDPYYVTEFNSMMAAFTSKYFDANAVRDDISKSYPSVYTYGGNVTFLDGNATTRRFSGSAKLMGTE